MTEPQHHPSRTDGRSSQTWLVVRLIFGAAGILFAGLALGGTWSDVRMDVDWSPFAMAGGVVLVAVATMMAARLWAALNPEMARAKSLSVYYAAIVGKYIPGGVFQFVGQVGYAARAGATVGRAAGTFLLSMVAIVSAGLMVSSVAAFESEFPTWVRVLTVVGAGIGVALTRRPILQAAVRFVIRVTRRAGEFALPSQRSLNASVAWGVAGLIALATSFSLVASQITGGELQFAPAAAFLVAWIIGFMAVPFPAGIGIREAVLVWLLSPALPTASIVAASLAQRLVTITSEIIVYAGSHAGRRVRD